MKKKILSFIIAAALLFNIAVMPQVSAVGEELEGNYTFIDTCYSPELGVYVAVAKDFVDAANQPAKLYASENGVEWTMARKIDSSKHYIFPDTRQTVVWWEAQHMFVALMCNKLLKSVDGYKWELVPESIYNKSNAMIETNGKQLVICAKASVLVYDDFDTPPVIYGVDKTANNNTYGKAVAVSPEEPYIYAVTDQYKAWLFDSRKEIDPAEEKSDASSSLTENIIKNPFDMAWAEGFGGWAMVNGTGVLRVLEHADSASYKTLTNMNLSDGTVSSEEFTALGTGAANVVLGTKSGKLLVAPNDISSMESGAVWTVAEAMNNSDNNEEILSVSEVSDELFFAVSKHKIYLLMKEEDGVWRFYDVANDKISLEETRFELPVSGMYTKVLKPVHHDYKGNVADDEVVSFDLISELPDGIVSEKIDDTSMQLVVRSTVTGGHEIKYRAVTAEGRQQDFTVTIVAEDHVEITGSDNMIIPRVGDPVEKYEYSFDIIGSDGKRMDREIAVEIGSMPEGVKFDSVTNVFTIDENTQEGEIVMTVYSKANPENRLEKRIDVSERRPAKIEFDEAPDAVHIPNEEICTYKYSATIYDQTDRIMPEEKVVWSVEAKDIESMDGVAMDKDTGELSLEKKLRKGTVTITAVSETDETLFIQKDVKLNYTDLRIVQEDFAEFHFDASQPVTGNLALVSKGTLGSTVKWRSTDENIIKPDGTVIRPSREDKKVTLTGTWKYNTAAVEAKYELLVKKADNLCVNGDMADGKTTGWKPKGDTVLTVEQDGEKNVLKSQGSGAYQTLTLTNDSSYGFNARVKAAAGSKIRLVSEKAGTIAEITASGGYQDIKESHDYRKQKNSFEDKIYLEFNGELMIEKLVVYEITLELSTVSGAVDKAVYSKEQSDINAANMLLAKFYDLPIRGKLYDKLNSISSSTGGSSGGSGGGGGGGSGASKKDPLPSAVDTNNSVSIIPVLTAPDDNTADELDTYLLRFKDMKNHWARADVEYMAGLGVVSGDENDVFRPDDNVSRAEFATMITRAMELEETPYANSFFDVVTEDWYSGYVQTVKSNDFMSGYDGLFKPNSAITREEIARVIVAAYNNKTNTSLQTGRTLYFNDLDDISHWAYDYIVEAADMGFIYGITDELFAPKQNATRAQAAAMLKRVYDKLHPTE